MAAETLIVVDRNLSNKDATLWVLYTCVTQNLTKQRQLHVRFFRETHFRLTLAARAFQ